jgi:hypothetical protein
MGYALLYALPHLPLYLALINMEKSLYRRKPQSSLYIVFRVMEIWNCDFDFSWKNRVSLKQNPYSRKRGFRSKPLVFPPADYIVLLTVEISSFLIVSERPYNKVDFIKPWIKRILFI